MIRVGVNGYGTIGETRRGRGRAQPDMELVGVTKTSPDYGAEVALRRGYDLYAAIDDRAAAFEDAGLAIAGSLGDLLDAVDVIVDCTPAGIGERNRPIYEAHDTPAIYQGGEDAAIADASFNARASGAIGDAGSLRVVSCNTTGLSRLLAPLDEAYGIEKARVTLVRRGGDPSDRSWSDKRRSAGPGDGPSHHGPDVNAILPDVDIDTAALKAPVTGMHTHSVNVTLEREPTTAEVRELLREETRLFLIPERAGIDGAGALKDYASDLGRDRGDLWGELHLGGVDKRRGRDLYLFQNVHQEADVVPENVDAIRALATDISREESVARTNEALGVGLDSLLSKDGATRDQVAADD